MVAGLLGVDLLEIDLTALTVFSGAVGLAVGYGSDLPLAQRLMIEAAIAASRVLTDPQPSVWLRAFGDSSVDHQILVWIDDPEMGVGNVQSDVLNRVWALFKEHGIEIPFPQQDVHIRSVPTVPPTKDDGITRASSTP